MSFLAGRLASTEGAYFLQESKQAVGRLAQKLPHPSKKTDPLKGTEETAAADVLPEILRHSIPLTAARVPLESSISVSPKWVLPNSGDSMRVNWAEVQNPLRAYVSLPQVTFGPKRWKLPDEYHPVSASTANELRVDRTRDIDPKKLKDAAEGLSQVGKAFAIATVLVFGGSTTIFLFTASKLQMHSSDDIKTKGRDLVQPRLERIKERLYPLRAQVERVSKKWHFERADEGKENPILRELSNKLGVKAPNK